MMDAERERAEAERVDLGSVSASVVDDLESSEGRMGQNGEAEQCVEGAFAGSSDGEPSERAETTARRHRRFTVARAVFFAIVLVLACAGLAFHTGTGTPSAWGWDMVSALCPLGALETLLAGREIVPRLVIGFIAMLIFVLAVGKAFCSWACPLPRLRSAFAPRKQLKRDREDRVRAGERVLSRSEKGSSSPRRHVLDSRHVVLGGALASSLAFGFPVFCLVCPVGLTFGTIVLLWRLVQFNQWSWAIVVFPLVLAVEVIVLRRWCGTLCPIGALLSLVSRGNKTLRPVVDEDACTRLSGSSHCASCAYVCPERIDAAEGLGDCDMNECVKCGRCIEACPAQAIRLRVLPQPRGKKKDRG